jgi:tripartite ATP-independent transporter DctM subunit
MSIPEWLMLPYEWVAPLMFLVLLGLIFLGVPVAFALGGSAVLFSLVAVGNDLFQWGFLSALPDRLFGTMQNGVLLAVPFFIFMGAMLEKSRLAEDLLETAGQLFGPVRGGLAIAVILVGTLLAAATGVVGASVVAMGMISLPVMLRYRYDKALATGVICASGTLGQIIPPSLVLIVLGDQLITSVSDLFKCALLPGLLMALVFMVMVGGLAALRPDLAPALPKEMRTLRGRALAKRTLLVLVPPLLLILFVLGSTFAGVATPTEAGALGAVGAMLLALANRRFSRTALTGTMEATTRMTTMVLFLLIGSSAFAHVFRGLHGEVWIEHFLHNLPGGLWGAILLINLVVLILGFFIDFFEIAFIVLPIVAPALLKLVMANPDVTAQALGLPAGLPPDQIRSLFFVWFGVVLGLNLQTSFLTPPFGFSLFYLKGVCPPEIRTPDIYRGVLPFIGVQIGMTGVVLLFPRLVLAPLL